MWHYDTLNHQSRNTSHVIHLDTLVLDNTTYSYGAVIWLICDYSYQIHVWYMSMHVLIRIQLRLLSTRDTGFRIEWCPTYEIYVWYMSMHALIRIQLPLLSTRDTGFRVQDWVMSHIWMSHVMHRCRRLSWSMLQPIPLVVTFSKAGSKLKAQSSNVSFVTFQWKETFELRALSFDRVFENVTPSWIGCTCISCYGVATISRLLKIMSLLQKRLYSAKETYILKEPTNHSHPISVSLALNS